MLFFLPVILSGVEGRAGKRKKELISKVKNSFYLNPKGGQSVMKMFSEHF
jgi:hypothetical protein